MSILGLHCEAGTLKIALLHKEKGRISFDRLQEIPLSAEDVKRFYKTEVSKKDLLICSGLEASSLLIREINLKLTSKRALFAALPFQLESLLPYPQAQATVLPYLYPKKTETDVTIFSALHTSLAEHIGQLNSFEIDPTYVSGTPLALLKFAKFSKPELSSLNIFYLGLEKGTYVVVNEGKVVLAQTFNFGLNSLLAALKKDSESSPEEEIDLTTLDKDRFPALLAATVQFERDLARMVSFLNEKKAPETFLLTGNIYSNFALEKFIKKYLEPSYKTVSLENLSLAPYALPIGFALEGLSIDKYSVQFRQGRFISPAQSAGRIKQCARLVAGGLALSCLMALFCHLFTYKKENLLKEELKNVANVQCADLQEGIAKWESELSKKKTFFPFVSTAPKVSDVLRWLSKHPAFSSLEEGEGIEIKTLKYSLVNYPKIGSAPVPYEAKLELEFSAASPTLARRCHDALLQSDPLINPKQEIAWKVNGNTYFTQIHLKTKSP